MWKIDDKSSELVHWSKVERLSWTRRNAVRLWLATLLLGGIVTIGTSYAAATILSKSTGTIDIHWSYLDYQSVYEVPASQIQRDLAPYSSHLPKITVEDGFLGGCNSVSRASGTIGPYKFVALMCQVETPSGTDWTYDWDGKVGGHVFYFDYPWSGGQLAMGWDGMSSIPSMRIIGRTKSGTPDSWSFRAASTLVKILHLEVAYPREPGSAKMQGSGFIGSHKISYKLTARAGDVVVPQGNVSAEVGHGQITGSYSIG